VSAVHPLRTADEVRASIVDAAQSCERALIAEAAAVRINCFTEAATWADVAEWDAIRSFAMAERFA
jgi:hypothetical protein